MKKIIILLPFLLLITGVRGQSGYNNSSSGSQDIFRKLDLDQDPRLESLVRLHMQRNQEGGEMQGFRVEIFFSSDLNARQKAQNTKASFLSSFPGYNVYITYASPDFKVRVGDFRTKNEALKLMKEVQQQFPRAFVVPDLIEVPKFF